MRIVVIEQPKPIVTPSQVPGGHAADDALVTTMIKAAQAEIDGPTGWLGRSLGEQTLELASECWPSSLPSRPIIEIESITVDDIEVEGVGIEFDGCLIIPDNAPRPARKFRCRYRAGYNGKPDNAPSTGEVPPNAVAAVILMTQELLAQTKANGGLRTFAIDGGFSEAYNSPEMVAKARTVAVDRLLAPLRVYAL
ncbi:phage gp6-like head-tail connector protein [Aureimonas mangrovi]|uniref:phage gp6-like head-tail connector protein n=1 Tax=Aureimonas mangrovi TaxID=2758041 RepID=UPI00163DA419|nr:phage gp6-like head-tail connector protein [Aureimonas mangrovi]